VDVQNKKKRNYCNFYRNYCIHSTALLQHRVSLLASVPGSCYQKSLLVLEIWWFPDSAGTWESISSMYKWFHDAVFQFFWVCHFCPPPGSYCRECPAYSYIIPMCTLVPLVMILLVFSSGQTSAMALCTEKATSPKSTRWRNSDFSVSYGTNSDWDFKKNLHQGVWETSFSRRRISGV